MQISKTEMKKIISDELSVDLDSITVSDFEAGVYDIELQELNDDIGLEDLYSLNEKYTMGQIFIGKNRKGNACITFTLDI